jgi:hypothetical protein
VLAKKVWTITGGLAAALAGLAAKHAIEFGWRKATGKEPPLNPESPNTDWTDAVRYAVLSGVALAVARLLARRFAAEGWQVATGELPPGLETVD